MLHQFLSDNRKELGERCRNAAALRTVVGSGDVGAQYGIPLFLDQLIETLRQEVTGDAPIPLPEVVDPPASTAGKPAIRTSATQHGKELFDLGYSVENVIHDYGDLCQAIAGLAAETHTAISASEFKAINLCLDDAIADAVTEFMSHTAARSSRQSILESTEKLGVFAHELRNQLQVVGLAWSAIKSGKVGAQGSTGALIDRGVTGLTQLIDQSLIDVRIAAASADHAQSWPVADVIAELAVSASLEADSKGCTFTVRNISPGISVFVDRDLLLSAINNLLHNAFKFTQQGTEISLHAYESGDRVLIDVADHCGGLPSNVASTMFEPFRQIGRDRTGLGLGLPIARRIIEASGGRLTVRDIVNVGCTFTIDLPNVAIE